jgi:hypothetical protein
VERFQRQTDEAERVSRETTRGRDERAGTLRDTAIKRNEASERIKETLKATLTGADKVSAKRQDVERELEDEREGQTLERAPEAERARRQEAEQQLAVVSEQQR